MKLKWNKKINILLVIVGFILLASIISPYITPYDPYLTDPDNLISLPNSKHILGTDSHGRDILSRIIIGSRTSIFSSIFLIITSGVFGTFVGLISGYFGGSIDKILMRITDTFLAFPGLLLAIAVAGILGGGLSNAIIALFVTSWTQYARLARSNVIVVKEEEYIYAAKLTGASICNILFKQILPNIIGPIIVTGTLNISTMMMGIAGLSFLGIGVKVPEAEWGAMINEGKDLLSTAPWVALAPSLVLVIAMIIFNLLGDEIRDQFDKKVS